ncbi:DUF6777 domain-containing protein [Streptomyces mobaraensis]|uniref:DUF6777 domain-containing protein n=1 Tax=Streptomyces mobaraensis TaxID=35621 RepID=A0A5N5W4R6_STRMB|nr:DUF6777 domain-containing protein [Streptomyces mobaraensis]KAB7839968.1 hypothetical protein FRZ00_20855 [Streptomyces mobaraensis]
MWLIPVPIDAANRRKRRRLRAVAVLAVPALAIGPALAACSSDDSGGGDRKKTIALEAVGQTGDAPFVSDPHSDVQGVSSTDGGGTAIGDAPGAFGGTRQISRCDKAQLLKDLAGDPVKAKAWAEARGIAEPAIREHVTGLTPAVLMHDTLVTNHDYDGDGRTRAYPAVLQAGVAVLVDAYGKPAVKCNCGNPLREPDSSVNVRDAAFDGRRWEGFAVATVTVILPRPAEKGPMKALPLVDTDRKDRMFHREVGDDGSHDSAPTPRPPTPSGAPGSPGTGTGSPSPGGSGPSSGPSAPSSGSSDGSASSNAPSDTPSGASSRPSPSAHDSAPSGSSPHGSSSRPPSTPHTPTAPLPPSKRPSAAPPTHVTPTHDAAVKPSAPLMATPPRTVSPPAARPAEPPSAGGGHSAPRAPSEERQSDPQRREPAREGTANPQRGTGT